MVMNGGRDRQLAPAVDSDSPLLPSTATTRARGVTAAMSLSVCSGAATVYTEAVLKGRAVDAASGAALLAAWGVLFSATLVWAGDGSAVAAAGLLQGWTPLVWAAAALKAAGGLLVSFFLRRLDGVLKNAAAACAVALSALAAWPLLGVVPTLGWALGTTVVAASLAIFSDPDVVDPPLRGRQPLLLAWLAAAGPATRRGGAEWEV